MYMNYLGESGSGQIKITASKLAQKKCLIRFDALHLIFVHALRHVKVIYAFICMLDAAKRKTLPAWIREGLEKMEREKQKKMEKERLEREKEAEKQREEAEKEAMDDMTESGEPHVPKKSRFVCHNFLEGDVSLSVPFGATVFSTIFV